MKLLLVGFVIFVISINGLFVGPEYTRPQRHEQPQVESVLPRLGAVSCSLKVDEEWRVYTTGGWAYLPSEWPAAFADCEDLTQQHAIKETTVYYPESNQWKYSNDEGYWGDLNHKRAFHVAESFNGSIYVWGGGHRSVEYTNGECDRWRVIPTEDSPRSRYASCSEVVDTVMYVFGGVEGDGSAPEDFLAFDFETSEWSKVHVASSNNPSPRYGASLDHYEGVLVLFGGTDAVTGAVLSDLWFFSLDTREWYYYNATEFDVCGSTFHGSAIFDNELFIFLGEGINEVYWRDVWIFNLETGNWSISEKHNHVAVPPTRSGFSCAFIAEAGAERVVILSGVRDTRALQDTYGLQAEVWSCDLYDLRWTRETCFPSFVFDEHAYTCVAPSTNDCEPCDSCTDMRPHRIDYVSKLKNKMITKDWSGALRQCPAYWRNSEFVV